MSTSAAPKLRARATRRVPVVLQQDPTECAAACLAMILGAHGRATPLAECRADCGTGRDGATAESIVRAARSRGLVARGFAATGADVASVPMPAIAHWQFNHFVVIERATADHFDVVDPADGRRRLSLAEFQAGFSGVVLTFEPGPSFEARAEGTPFTWRSYLWTLIETPGVRAGLLQVFVASLVLQALGLALPLFTKIVVDDLLPDRVHGLLPILALGIAVWIAAQALLGYMRSLVLLHVRTRLDAHVMTGFFEHLLSLPFRYFQTRTTGDLLTRLSSNSVLRELLTAQTISVVLDGILVCSYLVLLALLSPSVTVIVVSIGVLQGMVILSASARTTRLAQADLSAQSDSQSYLVEVLSGIGTLKAAGAEDRALEHWTVRFRAQLEASLRRAHFSTVVETGLGALHTAAPLFLLVLGARAVIAGEMSIGSMLAINALAASFLAPLRSLLSSAQNMQVVGAHLERIADVLQAESEQDATDRIRLSDARVRIELDGVSFRYAPASPEVVRDVTLSIEPGTKVAIVGPTGSGKSTLGHLLLGLHAPTAGSVRFGGHALAQLDLRALRRRFGVVLQDSALFAGTLRENIAFHDPSMPLEDIVDAARAACIHDDIENFPMGYETRLSEGGAGLSGGQKQRLALARALARKPDVLFLDEATSHLDAITEANIEAALARLGCTRVVIAHRLSTVRDAAMIFVLDQGSIAERGTHAELIARGALYSDLVRETRPGSALDA